MTLRQIHFCQSAFLAIRPKQAGTPPTAAAIIKRIENADF